MTEKKELLISKVFNILQGISDTEIKEVINNLEEHYSQITKENSNTLVYISENAFWGLLLSAIEVYKKECFGMLLGSYSIKEQRYNVEFAIPFQAAKRSFSWVTYSEAADKRVQEFLKNLPQLDVIGHFHSHAGGPFKLSKGDVDLIFGNQIMILVDIEDKKYTSSWRYHKDGSLAGAVSNYYIRLGAFYVPYSNHKRKEKKAKIICPYGFGFQDHLKIYKDNF